MNSLLQHALHHAKGVIEKDHKEIIAMAFLHIKEKIIAMPFKHQSFAVENFMKGTIIAFIKKARVAGQFDAAVVVAEAWLSRPDKGEKPIRPKDDPNREEVIVISVYSDSFRATHVFSVQEQSGRRSIGQQQDFQGLTITTWLDEAFANQEN